MQPRLPERYAETQSSSLSCYDHAAHSSVRPTMNNHTSVVCMQDFNDQPPTPEHMNDGLAELDMLPVPENDFM